MVSSPTAKKKDNKKNGSKENPYSFRKFLRKDATSSSSSPRPPRDQLNYHINGGIGPAPDFASDLPDFVQDHFSGGDFGRRNSNGSNGRLRTHSEISLPDFALDSTNSVEPPSTAESYSTLPSINAIGSLIGGREDGPSYRPSSNTSANDLPRHGGLPDFLSDSALIDGDTGNEDFLESFDRGELQAENRRVSRVVCSFMISCYQ